MNQPMNQLMTGAIAMGFALATIYFVRFWRETGDRLFGWFAIGSILHGRLHAGVSIYATLHRLDRHLASQPFPAHAGASTA